MDISSAADRLEQARSTNAGLPLFSRDPGGLSAEEAWAVAAEVDRRLMERGPDFVLYTIVDAMVDAHFPLLEQIAKVERGEDPMGVIRDPNHPMVDTNLEQSITMHYPTGIVADTVGASANG